MIALKCCYDNHCYFSRIWIQWANAILNFEKTLSQEYILRFGSVVCCSQKLCFKDVFAAGAIIQYFLIDL